MDFTIFQARIIALPRQELLKLSPCALVPTDLVNRTDWLEQVRLLS